MLNKGMKVLSIGSFERLYPNIFNSIIRQGKEEIKNFHIQHKMEVIWWRRSKLFFLTYPINSEKDALILMYYLGGPKPSNKD